jgi:hypothetical protein
MEMEEHLAERWFGLELFLYECCEIYRCILRFLQICFVVLTSRYVTGQMQTMNLVSYSEIRDRYRRNLSFECLDLKLYGDFGFNLYLSDRAPNFYEAHIEFCLYTKNAFSTILYYLTILFMIHNIFMKLCSI